MLIINVYDDLRPVMAQGERVTLKATGCEFDPEIKYFHIEAEHRVELRHSTRNAMSCYVRDRT